MCGFQEKNIDRSFSPAVHKMYAEFKKLNSTKLNAESSHCSFFILENIIAISVLRLSVHA
jgi:hypothetical protein